MSRILPDRCYTGIDDASIKHTEEHLRRAMRLRKIPNDDTVDRYLKRMSSCRKSRRCNLSSCPSCEIARQDRFSAEVIAEAMTHPRSALLCGDVLLEPRERLCAHEFNPKADLRRFRELIRTAFKPVHGTNDGLYLLGRYEVAVKRKGENAFLEHYAPGARSRSVVPHFHFVMIARENGKYVTPADIRARLVRHFPAPRQIMLRHLMPSQSTEQALDARVRYIFKKRTVEFNGRVLRDFVRTQVWFRQDMWTLRYRFGDLVPGVEQGARLDDDIQHVTK